MRRLLFLFALCSPLSAIDLRLPTANDALLKNNGPDYFQFVDRLFEGEKTTPWEGGQFGFWRDPRRISSGIAYARFHEGLDVKPLQRDARGDPLDDVQAILEGEVVHVTPSGRSNYGGYVVIKHDWGEGPFFSLYAHLKKAKVAIGEKISAGQPIAQMGYTGAGIDQRRAHVHVELNVMLSSDFESWHATGFRTLNYHGVYNGMNLLGLDLQALYLAHAKNPALSVGAWMREKEAWFEITVPGNAKLEVLKSHPWLGEGGATDAAAWQIRCTRWGLPVSIKPSAQSVAGPEVSWLKSDALPNYYATRGLISNNGKITVDGMRFIQLMAGL
jgi:murein DD-endopeptidase MepM/ murein hydrolase activator NlpD